MREVRVPVSASRVQEMVLAGKTARLDSATGEMIVSTLVDHLPANWHTEPAKGQESLALVDSYGNPIVNNTPGLPAWAQRDVDALRGAIAEWRDTLVRELATGADATETQGIFANFVGQAITRGIAFEDLVSLHDAGIVNDGVARGILSYMRYYENIRFANQELFRYTYSPTVYPANIQAFVASRGSTMANVQALQPMGTYDDRGFNCYSRGTFARGMTNLSGQTDIWLTTGDDDAQADVPTGFDSFFFFPCDNAGVNHDQVRVSTNGYITFFQQGGGTLDGTNFTNDAIPDALTPNGFAAPWWDDLIVATAQGNTDRVSYKTEGAVNSRVFTAEWFSMSRLGGSTSDWHFFQVKLYENTGVIELHLSNDWSADTIDSATIGIEDYDGTFGLCGLDCTNTISTTATDNYRYTPLRPFNDSCANADEVTSGDTITQASIRSASPDGETTCGASNGNPDIWYTYTAICDGTLRATTCGTRDANGTDSGADTVISAHSACPGVGANTIACSDDAGGAGCSGLDSTINVPMTSGQQVWVRVTHYGDLDFRMGNGLINVAFDFLPTSPAANDSCTNAQPVAAGSSVNGSIACATNDGSATCGSTAGNADAWYTFVAPCDGTVTFDTCGSRANGGADTVASIHTGCPGDTRNELACNDDAGQAGCNGLDSNVSAALSAGQRVLVRVTHFGSGNFRRGNGNFVLNTNFVPVAPPNDQCANAANLAGFSGNVTGSVFCATNDGTSLCGGSSSNPDVWYRWTNTTSRAGRLYLNTCGTHDAPGVDLGMDTVLNAYNGCPGGPIACNDDAFPTCPRAQGANFDSRLGFVVASARTMRVRVSHFGTSMRDGNFILRWQFNPCVADIDDGSFTGVPDGGVTIDDLLYYLELFRFGAQDADVDDGSGNGVADGGVTIDDLLYYLERFNAGC